MNFYTPLRYPGGKGKLANYLKLVFEYNNLLDGEYVEPYAGGAAVALELLIEQYASKIHINDIDPAIYAFWYSVLHHTEELCKKIVDTPVDMTSWHNQKHIQKNPSQASILELGFSTFFLNRTNRSGILKAGVIGGQNQTGRWKLDARYNAPELVSRIQRIARYRNRIALYNEDSVKLLQMLGQSLPEETLFYLDPPYYVKGEGLYEHHYVHEDHVRVGQTVSEHVHQKWLVSYDCVPQIAEIYSPHRQLQYQLSYTAADPSKGTEIIVFSDNLKVPNIHNPVDIRTNRAWKKATKAHQAALF